MDRRALLQLLGYAGLASLACGPSTPEPQGPDMANPDRDAHAIAAKTVGARVTMVVYMDRVRKHPLAPKLGALDIMTEAFEGTDIDPIQDVDRAVLAAKTARSQEDAIAVAEHRVAPERLKAAMTQMIAQSGAEGRWLEGYPFPAAKVVVRKRKTVVLAVRPNLLVVTSPKHAERAAALQNSGGIADPANEAAIVADANQPSSSLKASGVPPVPKTVHHVYAEMTLLDDGSANLVIDGESSSETQAVADAEQLSTDMEKAATVNMGLFKVKAFEPLAFKPDGKMVRARRRVTQKELDALLSLAAMMMG